MPDPSEPWQNGIPYEIWLPKINNINEDQTPDRSNFAKKLLEGLRSANALAPRVVFPAGPIKVKQCT